MIANLSEDTATLKSYNVQDGMCIHVVDSSSENILAGLDDLSQVEKYKMSDFEYNNRDNTFRKFK